jgi:hypothetical protein
VYDGYLGYVRGELELDLPYAVLDYTRHDHRTMRELLAALRPVTPRYGPGGGAFRPGVTLLVAERLNPSWTRADDVPFVEFSGRGCSTWLAEQLEAEGVRERDLYWVNAISHRTGKSADPGFLAQLEPGRVVALGAVAERWCREVAQLSRFDWVDHPQAHKRFHFHERYPLLDILAKET